MLPYLDETIPVVVIYNYLETFLGYLSRADDEELIRKRRHKGDRALLWLKDPKLVFVMAPIPHAEYLRQHWGYPDMHYLVPAEPSPWLSLDILHETRLLTQLVEYAGARRTVQLIPYATTREFLQLAETLRKDYALNVLLPESPTPDCLWLLDYIGAKSGFRTLASRWLPNASQLLPQGIVCRDTAQAAEVACWLGEQGQTCIFKADRGGSGIGHIILRPDECVSTDDVLEQLQANVFLRDDLIIVEEFIRSSARLSPSLEFFVPPLRQGQPEITYLSNQLFAYGGFNGVLISRELTESLWYPILAENGQIIAEQLQAMGYVGHFDLDAIVDDNGRIFLLEVNSRRTGGTHVHEFARFHFGPDYLDKVALLSHNTLSSEAIIHCDHLLEVIGDLLYPIRSEQRGVIITHTSALAAHEFGCIIVASTTAAALALQQAMQERLPIS